MADEAKTDGSDPANLHLKAVHEAIIQDDVDKLQTLCSVGQDLNRRFDVSIDPQHAGITPLALACALNKLIDIRILLDNGADVNEPFAALNTTALMTSAYHGHEDVVKLLLHYKADVTAVDLQQSTALGYAFGGNRNIEVVRMLLNHRVDVNQRNMLGMNALLLVAGYGNEEMVGLILGAGADPASVNDFGHTALHLAVVGKRDLLSKRKLQKAAAGEDSQNDVDNNNALNRRDLDIAVQEWARNHRDTVGTYPGSEEALAKAGRIMMSIGQHLEDPLPKKQPPHSPQQAPPPVQQGQDDANDLERRVRAMRRFRQEKLKASRAKRRSGMWTLLCGSSKSSKAHETSSKPYNKASPPRQKPIAEGAAAGEHQQEDDEKKEEDRISESFARILRMLIMSGCDVHRTDVAYGMTALDLAILVGDVESTAVLAAAGADPSHFLKMLALKDFYIAMISDQAGRQVRDLLTYDEDLDVNMPLSRFTVEKNVNDDGLMPLALAVRINDVEAAKLILKRGADINKGGPSGRPALCEAATKDNRKMVDLLLASAADIERSSPAYGDATPLAIAVIGQRHQIVDYFIKKGAKVDRPMRDGRIPLFKALETNDVDMVALLLDADVRKNFVDKNGFAAELATEYQKRKKYRLRLCVDTTA